MVDADTFEVITRARQALSVPAKYGYSDIGDALVSFLRNETDKTDTLEKIDLFTVDYLVGLKTHHHRRPEDFPEVIERLSPEARRLYNEHRQKYG